MTNQFQGVLAVDFGTSFFRAAVVSENGTQMVPNEFGKFSAPSCLSFKNGEILIGEPALVSGSELLLCDLRRIAGLTSSQMTHLLASSSAPIDATRLECALPLYNRDGIPTLEVKFPDSVQTFRTEELIAMILRKLKCDAEELVGQSVSNAVLSVPAHFGSRQRKTIKDAASIAGLVCLRLLSDTTAGILGYDAENQPETQSEICVVLVDFGGGKLNVTLFLVEEGIYEVLATFGRNLGGIDLDWRLVEYFAAEFHKRHGSDLRGSRVALKRLRTACTRAKIELSEQTRTRIEIEGLFEDIDFVSQLSRSKFEQICAEDFQAMISDVRRVLTEGGRSKEQVHDVILLGGCSKIPIIQLMLRDFFDGKQLSIPLNSEEFVVRGVGVQGGIIAGVLSLDILLLDKMSESLGIFPDGGVAPSILPRNTTIPCRRSIVLSTTEHNQPAFVIPIHGEKKKTTSKESPVVATCRLGGVAPAPAGATRVEVSMNVDANGILSTSGVILSYRDSLFQGLTWTLPQMSGEEIGAACDRLSGLMPDAQVRREMFL